MATPTDSKEIVSPSSHLVLISSEKLEVKVDREHAQMSEYVKVQDEGKRKIHCPIKLKTLRLIVEYVSHHEGKGPQPISHPLKTSSMKDIVTDKWDARWIDDIGDHRMDLYLLGKAAEIMGIESLADLVCAKIASLIKGCRNDDIRRILDARIEDGNILMKKKP
eukprot:CAMPEP_0184478462 /NCGR_PEP_ID=MMETSP0113_2-20130426/487_1 /TAXON_ID=91329 /ORGANISM="Norrisiella sphaerica, Strain BC52" /LENGTH=163 /DNA_ID=CAMNT_0026856267 /DNA_START=143 /DNA_END=634 /DNA_ORIENTATION=+